jgi:hypothetical protein
VKSVLPILLFALGGLLFGGVFSLRQQQKGIVPLAIVGTLAAVSVVGGVLWLVGEG